MFPGHIYYETLIRIDYAYVFHGVWENNFSERLIQYYQQSAVNKMAL
jgi:hypothetical protein